MSNGGNSPSRGRRRRSFYSPHGSDYPFVLCACFRSFPLFPFERTTMGPPSPLSNARSLAVHAHITSHHGNGIVSALPSAVCRSQASLSIKQRRRHRSPASIQDPPLLKAKGREGERAWHGGQRAFALSPPAVCTPPYSRVLQRSHGEVASTPWSSEKVKRTKGRPRPWKWRQKTVSLSSSSSLLNPEPPPSLDGI